MNMLYIHIFGTPTFFLLLFIYIKGASYQVCSMTVAIGQNEAKGQPAPNLRNYSMLIHSASICGK